MIRPTTEFVLLEMPNALLVAEFKGHVKQQNTIFLPHHKLKLPSKDYTYEISDA